jgi:hypothetical protein
MTLKNRAKTSWLRGFPLHPFLFAVYPVLALLAVNISEVDISSAYRPLAVALGTVVLFALMFRWFWRDWRAAAIALTIILVLFYLYGHTYLLLKGININGFHLFRHRTLIPIWLGAGALLVWLIARKRINLTSATYLLNVVGLFLLALPSLQLAFYFLQSSTAQVEAQQDTRALDLNVAGNPPDIYYIILDGYGRADVLQDQFGYDNSDFLGALRELGFYVAECSQSNYAQTQISLASSLNFDYIDSLSDRFTPGSDDRTGLDTLIKHSAVRASLEAAGYETVAFATGFLMSELEDADYYLAPQLDLGQLNEFEYLLVETTFARLIQDSNRLGLPNSGTELYRERTLFALDKLAKLSYIRDPKFVFVHLIVPHPPYVFGPTGGPIPPREAGTTRSEINELRYLDQTTYISNRLREILPRIIANSARPPLIVIQSDHGPTIPGSPQSRMKNLNAYYLPGAQARLYPTITPVNTFRIIFNIYFGQSLALLEDISWYSSYEEPFRFRPVPNLCAENE